MYSGDTTPLLGRAQGIGLAPSSAVPHEGGEQPRAAGGGSSSSTPAASPNNKPAAKLDLHFWQRFLALLRLLRPYPALVLAALSILESVTVAEVGKITGSFYRIMVDNQASQLAGTLARSAVLYAACCAIYAASTWVAQGLAVRWRLRLTDHLQQLYCRGAAFYHLQKETDNPDQRIAFDASALCDSLGSVVKVVMAAPFKVAYYAWLTQGYTGWRGLLAVFGFFWGAAGLQRLVMAPVARAVYRQERLEGDLRFAHLRLREYAAEAAQYGGGAAEGQQLAKALKAAVDNQQRLVWLRTGLAASTRGIDYCGAMLNYGLVAAAVFAGMAGTGGDSGALAQWVSNASFATLMLIYSFTELLDLSHHLSNMAGLTARVGQLLEALSPGDEGKPGSRRTAHGPGDGAAGAACTPAMPPLPSRYPLSIFGGALNQRQGQQQQGQRQRVQQRRGWQPWQWLAGGGRGRRRERGTEGYRRVASPSPRGGEARLSINDGEELRPSELAELVLPPTLLSGALPDGSALELSIHRLGPDLRREMGALFPGAALASPLAPAVGAASAQHAIAWREGQRQGQQCSQAQRQGQQRGQQTQGQQRVEEDGWEAIEEEGEGELEGRMGSEGKEYLACLTFQFAAGDVSLAPDSSAHTLDKASLEMDRMLHNFLQWERAVRAELAARGPYWCDAIDPRTAMALHGAQGTKWSEVAAAHALLGYERREAGICPVILHPLHGTSAYPVTLFTDAPLHTFQEALAAACRIRSPQLPDPASMARASSAPAAIGPLGPHLPPLLPPSPRPAPALPPSLLPAAADRAQALVPGALLELRGVTVRRLDGGLAVASLSLTLPPGGRLLISGPNGCGKSTLLKAVCGLHPLEEGWMAVGGAVVASAAEAGGHNAGGVEREAGVPPPVLPALGVDALESAAAAAAAAGPAAQHSAAGGGLMVVPQRPLAAPGPELWQQVVYPDTQRPSNAELRRLLAAVGLGYLEARVRASQGGEEGEGGSEGDGDTGGVQSWAMLSPGELQRLSVARVLHRRPTLVLLDEITASVSAEAAGQLYGALRSAGIACVSVGQDCQHLRALHSHHLRVGVGAGVEGRSGVGSWELLELER